MTTTAVAWAALAIAVVAAVVIALEHRHGVVLGHEIDLLRQRADKTDTALKAADAALRTASTVTAQLRTDIDAATEWAWQHHDAHGWGEEPAEPVHPATQAIPVVTGSPSGPQVPVKPDGAVAGAPQMRGTSTGNPGISSQEKSEPPATTQNPTSAPENRPTPGPRHGSDERMTRAARRQLREGNDG